MTSELSGGATFQTQGSPIASHKQSQEKATYGDHNCHLTCISQWIPIYHDSEHTPGNITPGSKSLTQAGFLVTTDARAADRLCWCYLTEVTPSIK